MRLISAAVLSVALVAGCAGAAAAPTASLVDIGAGLQGPAGLAATTYATGLANVAAVAFDDDDRLWAATASFTDDGTDAVYLVPPPVRARSRSSPMPTRRSGSSGTAARCTSRRMAGSSRTRTSRA